MLELYDRYERREVDDPGMRRETADGVVRQIDLIGKRSMVICSDLEGRDVDAVIRREAAYFGELGHEVEWKVYGHDEPQDLHDRLLAHGFAADDPEAIMALDLSEVPAVLLRPASAEIRKVTDGQTFEDFGRVNHAVWPEKAARFQEQLGQLLRTAPDRLSIYVAYVDGEPVSAGRIHFSPHSVFAGIWGGATLPAYRGQGLYTQLVALRAQEAIQRGASYLTIDAGPMSRPIVEKQGFRLLDHAQAHVRERPTS